MAFQRSFATISFWLALPFGIVCGILLAFKAGNPLVFILGFMVGLVFIMAMYVLVALIVIPAIKIFLGKRQKKPNP
jgi:hypothetical protein